MQEIVRFFRSWEYSLQIRQMRVTEFLETYPYTVPELRLVADEVRRTLLSHTYSTGQEVWEEVLEKYKSVLGVPEDVIAEEELKKTLVESLDLLTEKERKVIELYYYEEMTLKEISKILEVSESRISQLHTKALVKMKKTMGTYMDILID